MKFSQIDGIILDMDGVLWRGDQPLPAMQELFAWLDESGTPYALATNNSGKSPEDYIEKLAKMDVHTVPLERIITSGTATADYMQMHYPAGTPVYVFGMDGLRRVLDAAGFDVSGDASPQAVIVGVNFDVNYTNLRDAALYIRSGADFIGTNPDKTFPSPAGLVPGAGSFVAALQAATDVEPVIIGKPAVPMFEAAMRITGTAPDRTLMIGDRLDTDIMGGRDSGTKTALLFTGVTTPEELSATDNDIWPDVAYEGLPELLKAWAGDRWYLDKMKAKKGRT